MQAPYFLRLINLRHHVHRTCRGIRALADWDSGILLPEFGIELMLEFLLEFDRSCVDNNMNIFEIDIVVHLSPDCR